MNNMDELIKAIYEVTVSMNQALSEEDYEKINSLLSERNELMRQVDLQKEDAADFQYSQAAKQWLEETIRLDEVIVPTLQKSLEQTGSKLNEIKLKKQLSRKFNPYIKQTNGAFIDTIK